MSEVNHKTKQGTLCEDLKAIAVIITCLSALQELFLLLSKYSITSFFKIIIFIF